MNKEQILKKYRAKHSALGSREDSDDKDEFDREHREIWNECDQELRERSVELENKDRLSPKEQQELEDLRDRLA